jgi:hypothetical protein
MKCYIEYTNKEIEWLIFMKKVNKDTENLKELKTVLRTNY